MDRHGRCVLAVSEGITDRQKAPIAESLSKQLEKDAHGNLQLGGGALADYLTKLVKDRLGYKRVRGDTFGYVQRSFAGCVSDVDQREAREAGHRAVQYAMSGGTSGSVTIHRTGNYSVDYRLSPLGDIAAKTRTMPDDFIAASGTHVTEAFHGYLAPLLGTALPQVHRLSSPAVPKVLKPG
jgi:6-phosphofructokinase 1